MSYDLMFAAGPGRKIQKKAFKAYFQDRPNYQAGQGQALYQNEDTGVYFLFDEPEDGVVAFNLNYLRPHVFGLEAAPELEQFAQAFGARVADPQGEMDETGAFSRDAFLRGWNAGNAFAFRAMLEHQTEPVHTWPSERIQKVWEWNYGRRAQQEQMGDDVFVPGVFPFEMAGELLSMAIWPPNCPILLPAVDAVLVPVTPDDPECQDLALARWDELSGIVIPYRTPSAGAGLAAYRLAFPEWPSDLAAFLGKSRTPVETLTGIGLDQVLDREMVEEAGPS